MSEIWGYLEEGRPEDLVVSKKCPSVGRIWSIPKAESELKGWVKSWRFEVLGCSPGNGWGGAWGQHLYAEVKSQDPVGI